MRVIGPEADIRVLREFGLALRNAPFRAALVLSLLVHATLLSLFLHGGSGAEDDQGVRLMRVRLLRPASASAPVPDAPAVPPVVRPAARERAERPAAVAPDPPVDPGVAGAALVDSPPATSDPGLSGPPPAKALDPAPQASTAKPEGEETSQPAQAPPHEEPIRQSVAAASSPSAAGETAPVEPPAGSVVRSPAPAPAAAAAAAAAAGIAESASASNGPDEGTGSEPQPSADGSAAGTAHASVNPDAGADGGPPGQEGPGPGDLAAVRRRIEKHKVYPPIAVRNGWEGVVLVKMHLESDGRLAAVRLLRGSGFAVLDEATISAVRRASPFPPVARVLTVPVEYRLVP